MQRTVRVLSAAALTMSLSVLAGAGVAGAQEMDHGRTRPYSREIKSNVVTTQEAIANTVISNVRG